MDRLYAEHDKIMLLKTGQILTVHEDLSNHLDPGIIVKEKTGRLIRRSEVRPAGATRQRLEIEKHIVPKESSPPPPESHLQVEIAGEIEALSDVDAPSDSHDSSTMIKRYKKGDKIVLKDTGEVLTVLEDLRDRAEAGIVVEEKEGFVIMSCDVRPAGRTRHEMEMEAGITDT